MNKNLKLFFLLNICLVNSMVVFDPNNDHVNDNIISDQKVQLEAKINELKNKENIDENIIAKLDIFAAELMNLDELSSYEQINIIEEIDKNVNLIKDDINQLEKLRNEVCKISSSDLRNTINSLQKEQLETLLSSYVIDIDEGYKEEFLDITLNLLYFSKSEENKNEITRIIEKLSSPQEVNLLQLYIFKETLMHIFIEESNNFLKKYIDNNRLEVEEVKKIIDGLDFQEIKAVILNFQERDMYNLPHQEVIKNEEENFNEVLEKTKVIEEQRQKIQELSSKIYNTLDNITEPQQVIASDILDILNSNLETLNGEVVINSVFLNQIEKEVNEFTSKLKINSEVIDNFKKVNELLENSGKLLGNLVINKYKYEDKNYEDYESIFTQIIDKLRIASNKFKKGETVNSESLDTIEKILDELKKSINKNLDLDPQLKLKINNLDDLKLNDLKNDKVLNQDEENLNEVLEKTKVIEEQKKEVDEIFKSLYDTLDTISSDNNKTIVLGLVENLNQCEETLKEGDQIDSSLLNGLKTIISELKEEERSKSLYEQIKYLLTKALTLRDLSIIFQSILTFNFLNMTHKSEDEEKFENIKKIKGSVSKIKELIVKHSNSKSNVLLEVYNPDEDEPSNYNNNENNAFNSFREYSARQKKLNN
jgi:hypothetical protein